MTVTKKSRNALIVLAYRRGVSPTVLAKRYRISRARTWQILRLAGVRASGRAPVKKIGVRLDEELWYIVGALAELHHTTQSQIISDVLTRWLASRGKIR